MSDSRTAEPYRIGWHRRAASCVGVVVAVVTFLATSSLRAQPDDLPSLIADVTPSVGTIIAYGSVNQKLGHGSGFVIDNGLVVTSRHVIESASKATLVLADGREFQVSGMVADSVQHDLALLQVSSPSLKPLQLAMHRPRVGEFVLVVGSPMDEELSQTVSTGIVSGVREDYLGFDQVLQFTAEVSIDNGIDRFGFLGEVLNKAQGLRVILDLRKVTEDLHDLNGSYIRIEVARLFEHSLVPDRLKR